jgi:hypothetical protein
MQKVFKKWFLGILPMAIVLGICFCIPLTAFGQANLNSWQKSAFKYFQNDEYENSEKIVKQHSEDRFSKILIAFIHHQQWVYSRSKSQKEVAKGDYKALTQSLGIQDIDYLALVAQEKDKPSSAKMAKKLLQKTFKNLHSNEDVPILVEYLSVPEPDLNKYSLDTLRRILSNRRRVVKKGGSLRKKDIKMMTDPALLNQLMANVSQEEIGRKKPTYAKGISKAVSCLVLIEEPSLSTMENLSGLSVEKARVKVQKAINSRKKKYPQSSWHSATGKTRS